MVATQSNAEGGPGTGTTTTSTSVLSVYPHLGHYVFSLLSTNFNSPPKAAASHHPLSVSSSGESDDEDEGKDKENKDKPGQNGDSKQAKANGEGVDKEALVRRIVEMLDNEEEDEVKDLLKPYMGDLGKDEILMDQVCLDCMHRRRDDVEGIAFGVPHYLTPTRTRSAASITAAPHRPFTPTRLPSFRARTPLGRPQSPSLSASGTLTPTSMYPTSGLARSDATLSPSSSTHALPSASGPSSSGSPVSSPRMLSAKAVAFNPSPRAVSAPLSAVPPSFSPSDPWKDVPADPPRSASPFGAVGAPSMTRTSSNLAIAAPLFSDQLSPFHSPIGTPNKVHSKVPDPFSSPSLMKPSSRGIVPEDDDDDEFSPFGSAVPKLRPQGSAALNTSAKAFEPDSYFGSAGIPHSDSGQSYDSYGSGGSTGAADAPPEDDAGTGMTPLDVLSSVFSTIPKVELEDALHRSGYDFESAMAMLVSSHTLPRSGASTPQRVSSPRPLLGVGGRGAMPLSHAGPKEGYFTQGGRTYGGGSMSPGLMGGTRSPGGPATRMCRYFLAGECRRSDCRFSHDLDRALCRFWLRGHCAKGPNCEFLHQFPNGFDPSALSNAMSRVELGHDGSANHSPAYPPHHGSGGGDEFPDLLAAKLGRAGRFDPSRNRFANAVKRPVPGPITMPSIQIAGSRYGVTPQSRAYSPAHTPTMESRTTVLAVPRPSQRIKLRPPTLLPTVKTGAVANEQYMNSRATAIRLGHARNACLARAADAFRRGDGAAAKRFSREGKSLNERMLNEMSEAAQTLVQDRREDVQRACRERDINWSDDPSDRTMRGKECGGGLGVIMGVASKRSVVGGDYLSMDERLESLIDLHTLHGNEAGEMLGYFLAELEKENYRGLAYVLVGEEKHVGTQDPGRGASKIRLAASVKQCLAEWGYAWNETAGVICVDPCRF